MSIQTETLACDDAVAPRERISLRRLLKVAIAIAVALVIVNLETWAFQQSPIWSSACAFKSPTVTQSGASLPDTAGPIAVLH